MQYDDNHDPENAMLASCTMDMASEQKLGHIEIKTVIGIFELKMAPFGQDVHYALIKPNFTLVVSEIRRRVSASFPIFCKSH